MKTHREILFRGFCPNENGKQIITLDGEDIRGDWVYGDLIHNIDCVKVRERETDINRIAKSYIVEKETVGQYTGLKGKDDRRIWEGDIVASYGKVFKTGVKWNETQAGYAPFCSEGTSFFADECSIIGDKFNTRSVE